MPTLLVPKEMVLYMPKNKDSEVKDDNFKSIVKNSYGDATDDYINKTGGIFGQIL